jgi:hypothetical protein
LLAGLTQNFQTGSKQRSKETKKLRHACLTFDQNNAERLLSHLNQNKVTIKIIRTLKKLQYLFAIDSVEQWCISAIALRPASIFEIICEQHNQYSTFYYKIRKICQQKRSLKNSG